MKRRFDLYLPIQLYEKIILLSKHYKISKTKMIIKLLELGYLEFNKQDYRKENI